MFVLNLIQFLLGIATVAIGFFTQTLVTMTIGFVIMSVALHRLMDENVP